MSRRVTRSMRQTLEEPLTIVPKSTTSKPKTRPLTEDDIQRIKKLLVAFMIHRKRDNSPTDYNDWDQLHPVLKEGFDNVLKGRTTSTSALNQSQRKWKELCESLVASGVTSWTSLMSGIKKALSRIKYNYENPVEDLLREGHIRKNIFKNLKLLEIKKLLNRRNISDFSNDEKLDLLSQINDPTSAINEQIHISILEGSYEFILSVLNIQADIIDKNGNVTDTVKVDVNVINPTYGTYLESTLKGKLIQIKGNHIQTIGIEHIYKLATHLLDLNADASIPMKMKNDKFYIAQNAFSYALLNSASNSLLPSMWDIVKYILRNRPISDFYHPKLDSPHAFGKIRTFSPYDDTIDLVWIIKRLSITQINWLITHGGLNLQTMLEDYEIALNDITKTYEPLKADLDRLEQERNDADIRYSAIMDKILDRTKKTQKADFDRYEQELNETEKNYHAIVKKIKDKTNEYEPYQTQYNALQNKRKLIQQLRDAHNLRGGKTKRK